MNLNTSSLKSFTSRMVQLLSQKGSNHALLSGRQEHLSGTRIQDVGNQPRLRHVVHNTTSVQIALMQRMGVKGRPLMEACKRRTISI